jgi:outer membrane murein-binding lipoprotein Lpp
MVDAGGSGVERRLDRLETKVDGLDTQVGQLDARVGQLDTKVDALDEKVDRMHGEIGEAFVEQRTCIFETADSLRRDLTRAFESGLSGLRGELTHGLAGVRGELTQGLAGVRKELTGVQGELESMKLTATAGFDTLERKLDAFTEAQAVVNQKILARLGG